MKKIVIAIVFIVVLVAVVLLLSQADKPVADSAALMKSAYLEGGSAVCDFTEPEYGQKVEAYIKGGKMRFITEMSDEFFGGLVSNIVIKDNFAYFWVDGEDEGMKMKIEEEEIERFFFPFMTEDEEGNVVVDEDFQLECRKQSINDSMFDLPENIEFEDAADMLIDLDVDESDLEWDDDFELTPEMLEDLGVEI